MSEIISPTASASSPSEPLVTTAEAAHSLALAPRTLERWRSRGAGPVFVRLGRAVRYRTADLHSWLAAQTSAVPAGSGAA